MNEFKINGTQGFMGVEIPIIEGGFGKNKKCISDKTVSKIHNQSVTEIRKSIGRNIKRFATDIDYIDLGQRSDEITTLELLINFGYSKQSITQAEHIYILSERGYAKLIKIMDTDLAWVVHDKLIDEYFSMREIIQSDEQLKSKYLLSIYNGGQDAVIASKELTRLEVAAATAPLQKEIVHKQEVINSLTDNIPLYEKPDIINRICRRSYGGYANRYKELYKCFRENFHTDLMRKCENYNEKQEKKKDRLTTIRYAEKFDYIDDLYSCCVKLYETEVQEILEELNELR